MCFRTFLVLTLLFIVAVRCKDAPTEDEEKFKSVAKKWYATCADIQEIADMGRANCYVNYLINTNECSVEAFRNVIESDEQDNSKFLAQVLAKTCNRNDETGSMDYLVRIAKYQYDNCHITFREKVDIIQAAVQECKEPISK